jgi:hypothetical protein
MDRGVSLALPYSESKIRLADFSLAATFILVPTRFSDLNLRTRSTARMRRSTHLSE